ncbi:MAG: CHAD domain-containing protein [Myxococcota bacterium]
MAGRKDVLQRDLRRLEEALQRVVDRAGEEDIHDARIAARKAHATLRLLRPADGSRRLRRADRALRELRRELGSARDLDVALLTLKEPEHVAVRALLGDELMQRAERARRKLPRRVRARGDIALHAVGALRGRDLASTRVAGKRLRQKAGDVVDAAQRLASRRTWKRLHNLRKRLRELRYQLKTAEKLGLTTQRPGRDEAFASASQLLGRAMDLHILSVLLEHEDLPRAHRRRVEALARGQRDAVAEAVAAWLRRGERA